MEITTLYHINDLRPLYVQIKRCVWNDMRTTYDLNIKHNKSTANAVMITVDAPGHVLDVVMMALTLYTIEDLINKEQADVFYKEVKIALGF